MYTESSRIFVNSGEKNQSLWSQMGYFGTLFLFVIYQSILN